MPERQLIFGLPDVIGVDVATNVERLADGAQAAITARAPTARYRVLYPQELASPPSPEGPPPDMSAYLALPGSLPPQIGETARAAVEGKITTYERALALEEFLRQPPYSYQVQPLPGGGDAVYQFLFEMRQGYCTYYASAMAVLARSLGIPARVASGYATGAYDQASGTYVVREADAHAWPELYIDGRWLPFEPTPIRPLPARASGGELPAPATETSFEEPPATVPGPLIWLAVLAALAAADGGRHLVWPSPSARVACGPGAAAAGAQRRARWRGLAARRDAHEYGALLEPRLDGIRPRP